MGRTSLTRTIGAILAGAALVLTTAGSCAPVEQDGDDGPGVNQQQDDDGADDDQDDDGGQGDDD